MLKFYFNGSPNPTKVALFLEESGLPTSRSPVDTRKGDQFKPEFLEVNPNAKVPAIDDDGVLVFDSNAILLYLAEKTGKFLPPNYAAQPRPDAVLADVRRDRRRPIRGQAVHFKHFAPEKVDYSHNRYQFEAQRHYTILNDHLAGRYMVGDTYTIVDMACGAGRGMSPFVLGEEAAREISQRQAAGRRDLGAAGGGQGDRAEGQVQLQGRDGRRGARQHVPPPQDQGGVSQIADNKTAPFAGAVFVSAVDRRDHLDLDQPARPRQTADEHQRAGRRLAVLT